jgi:hypothetical protein
VSTPHERALIIVATAVGQAREAGIDQRDVLVALLQAAGGAAIMESGTREEFTDLAAAAYDDARAMISGPGAPRS